MTSISVSAILFDLDGVLVDSRPVVERTWQRWAQVHGLDVSKILSVAHGRRTSETLRAVAPKLNVADEAAILSQWELEDVEGLVAIPEARLLLEQVTDVPHAVVTSGSRALAQLRLRCVGMPQPPVMVTAEDVSQGKPEPEGYLKATGILGVQPSDCLVIEDAPAGVEAGIRAGMSVLAITTTHGVDVLSAADWIVDNLQGIEVKPNANGSCDVNLIRHAV